MVDPFDLHGYASDLACSVNRSNYFLDSDDLCIAEWLGGNPFIRHFSDLSNGLIPDLVRSRLLNHQQISWWSATPTDEEIDLSIPTQILGMLGLLVTAVLTNPILRRTQCPIFPVTGISNPRRFTDYTSRGALRIAVLARGLIAGSIDGCTIA